jgi:hypothetical protein
VWLNLSQTQTTSDSFTQPFTSIVSYRLWHCLKISYQSRTYSSWLSNIISYLIIGCWNYQLSYHLQKLSRPSLNLSTANPTSHQLTHHSQTHPSFRKLTQPCTDLPNHSQSHPDSQTNPISFRITQSFTDPLLTDSPSLSQTNSTSYILTHPLPDLSNLSDTHPTSHRLTQPLT